MAVLIYSFSAGTEMLFFDQSSLPNNLNCSYSDSDYWLTKKLIWKKMTQHKQKKKDELNSSADIS